MKNIFFAIFLGVTVLMVGCAPKEVGRSYYPSGKIKSEAVVINGVVSGPSVMFYEDGKKMGEANYEGGFLTANQLLTTQMASKRGRLNIALGY